MSVPESGTDIHIARPNINFSKLPPSVQANYCLSGRVFNQYAFSMDCTARQIFNHDDLVSEQPERTRFQPRIEIAHATCERRLKSA